MCIDLRNKHDKSADFWLSCHHAFKQVYRGGGGGRGDEEEHITMCIKP